MKSDLSLSAFALWLSLGALFALPGPGACAQAGTDPLPSWNEGTPKQAIIDFVKQTTDPTDPGSYVRASERIATFDQDGTLWVEQPTYPAFRYYFNLNLRLHDAFLAPGHPGDAADEYDAEVQCWLNKAKHPKLRRRYTDLVYQPMVEVLHYLRSNGYKTYIVTGGEQDFVRTYSERTYGIPPYQVIGSTWITNYGTDKDGLPRPIKQVLGRPQPPLGVSGIGKREAIERVIKLQPRAAFGNSTGDQQMLEYTTAGPGKRLAMLVLHDDHDREYDYGPTRGLPATKVGPFTPELDDEATVRGWTVISMKRDWKRIFADEGASHTGSSTRPAVCGQLDESRQRQAPRP